MIQRIQSIFLLIIIISLGISLFFPITNENGNIQIKVIDNFLLAISVILSMVICTFTILLYAKRKLQLSATWFLIIFGFIFAFELGILKSQSIANPQSKFIDYIFAFPIIQIVFSVLAQIFIRKDIKLIESADRLR